MAEISIGVYLFSRLRQLGIKSITGVPGGIENPSTLCPSIDMANLLAQ